MPPKRAALPHIEALDGLRGLAVLAILLFHAGHLRGGWLGVDVFFVLSGFLITSLLLGEHESTGGISLTSFWGRRARRLLPALFATLLGVGLYAVAIARPEGLGRIRADAIATLFYVQNWHAIAAGQDYWQIFRAPSPLDHTWSLSIEEQFYLLWPPAVLWLLRRARGSSRALAGTAGALALLSAAWMATLYDPDRGTARVYFGTDTRMAATLLGAAVAAGLRARVRAWPGPSSRIADATALAGLLALCAASLGLEGSSPVVYRGGLFALGLASAAVVAGAVLAPRGIAARITSWRPLRLLGLVSYGVYLWHWPIYLVLTPERVGWSGWPLTLARIAPTLLVATLSYLALEQPIRSRARLRERAPAAALAAGVGVLACVWLATPSAPKIEAAREAAVPSTAPSGRLDVLLIGDSVAYALGEEFRKEAGRRGQRAEVLAAEGCVALRSQALRFLNGRVFDLRPCAAFRERWVASVARLEPALVLLLEGWSGEGAKRIAAGWSHPCRADFDAAHAADLTDLILSIGAAGAVTAVVVMPPPSVPDLSPSFSHQWAATPDAELDALFRERVACQNRVREQVARKTGAILLDLRARVCPGDACLREVDGFVLRSDGMHFEGRGAAWASRWLLDRIDPRASLRGSSAGR